MVCFTVLEMHLLQGCDVALVNIDAAVKRTVEMLSRMSPPAGIEILTYKRNRGISLLLREDNTVMTVERGYREAENIIPMQQLGKFLKGVVKREFPRSRKVRFYQLNGPDDMDLPRKKL